MSIKYNSDKKLLEHLSIVLQENLAAGKVDVKTLADTMSISTCQLNRRVKHATGLTAYDYVLATRLQKAKQMLGMFPEVTIFETARQCGFADTAHFSHVFRRKEGMSPTQYIHRLKALKTQKNE